MDITLFDNHPVITSGSQVDELVLPLRKFGITYFSFSIVDNQARLSGLCNRPELIKLYLIKKYYNVDLFKDLDLSANQDKQYTYILWDNIKGNKLFEQLYQDVHQHNISHGFTIAENHSNCQYIFTFGAEKANHTINEFYYNNLDILHVFISYFKSMITQDKHLKKVLDAKFKLEIPTDYNVLDPIMTQQLLNKSIDKNNLRINKFILSTLDSRSNLTKHELQCLYWLRQGKTVVEISEIVYRSRRTIEDHVANIKQKLKCKTLLQVGEKISSLGLSKLLDNQNLFINV